MDLFSPTGPSVNNAISTQVHYVSVLDAAAIIWCLGPGTLMAKVDLKNAYRVLPVHPDDHPLLLLRSAPKIYSAFADALAWVLG